MPYWKRSCLSQHLFFFCYVALALSTANAFAPSTQGRPAFSLNAAQVDSYGNNIAGECR